MKIFLFSIIIFITSCDGSEEPIFDLNACIASNLVLNQEDEAYVTFQNNRAKWNCLDIKHYSFIFIGQTNECNGSETYLEVKDGEIIETIVIDPKFSTPICVDEYATVERLIERISEALDISVPIDYPVIIDALGGPLELAHKVIIEYDEEYGIPVSGFIDYIFGLADEEFNFEIKDFTMIE